MYCTSVREYYTARQVDWNTRTLVHWYTTLVHWYTGTPVHYLPYSLPPCTITSVVICKRRHIQMAYMLNMLLKLDYWSSLVYDASSLTNVYAAYTFRHYHTKEEDDIQLIYIYYRWYMKQWYTSKQIKLMAKLKAAWMALYCIVPGFHWTILSSSIFLTTF